MSEQSRMQTSSLVSGSRLYIQYGHGKLSHWIEILHFEASVHFWVFVFPSLSLFFLEPVYQMRMKNNYHITVFMLFVLLTAGVQQPLNIELTAICEFEPSLNLCWNEDYFTLHCLNTADSSWYRCANMGKKTLISLSLPVCECLCMPRLLRLL